MLKLPLFKHCNSCDSDKVWSDFYRHPLGRYGRSTKCAACQKEYRETNKERINAHIRDYRAKKKADPEYSTPRPEPKYSSKTDYYRRNRKKVAAWRKEYVKGPYKAQTAANNMKRHAAKLERTPAWADNEAIKEVYKLRDEMTEETGVQHHVDHIIPLRGEKVSGLHVPDNLQVITAFENLSKHNRVATL
jgi:hypothetical protein